MRFRPFKITYEAIDGETVVLMHGRDGDGEKRVVRVEGTEPHFFVKTGEAENVETDRIKRVEKGAAECFLTAEKLDKVVTRFPFDVKSVRGEFGKTWEADVLYENRVRYDLGIMGEVEVPSKPMVQKREVKPLGRHLRPGRAGVRGKGPLQPILPRWAVYDIETWDRGGFHGSEDPRAPVVSIAAWDSFSDRYVCILNAPLRAVQKEEIRARFKNPHDGCEPWKVQVVEVASEEAIFSTFNKWIQNVQPDVLVGWNSAEFDDPYLENRARRCGFPEPDFSSLLLFDAEDGYIFSKYQRPPSSALHYIATQEFNLPGKSTDKRIWEMVQDFREDLVFYNVNDVFLTKEIVQQSGIMDFYLRLADRAGTALNRCFSTGHLVDSMVFHFLEGTGKAQPTKKTLTKKEKAEWGKIKGAEVFDPSSGLFPNVAELDNGGEYPAVMRTFNLSPETFLPKDKWEEYQGPYIETPNGNRYRLDIEGVFPQLLAILTVDRDKAKAEGDKIGDDVNKKLSNTFFGVTPSATYRMPNREFGGDITGLSREHLKWNKRFCVEWKHKARVLYGDTDSNHVFFLDKPSYEDAVKMGRELAQDLNDSFLAFARQFGPVKNCYLNVKLENDRVYDRFLQAGTKKKYAAIYRSDDGEIERNGIRYALKVRGFEIRRGDAAEATKELQTEVITEMLFGSTRSDVIQMVHDRVQYWKKETHAEALWKLGKPKIVSKAKQVLRAQRYSNAFLGTEFRRGDKPAMFYGYVAGNPKGDVFLWAWREAVPPGTKLDVDITIDAVLLSPLEGPLDLFDLRPSDCKNPVEIVEDWI